MNARGATTPPADPLGRLNPRSSVTRFLEACHRNDYATAAQYLDLTHLPSRDRATQGVKLARQLEAILNSASRFDVLQLSQNPQGNLTDDNNPDLEHVVTVNSDDTPFTLELERTHPATGPQLWLFTPATVAAIPGLPPKTPDSVIAARLPRFLVAFEILETPLWKWLALLTVAIIVVLLLRAFFHLLRYALTSIDRGAHHPGRWLWLQAILDPVLVLVAVAVFRIAEESINPAALTRLYVGRALLLIVVSSVAWGVVNLFEVFLGRLDSLLDPRQRVVSHSLILLGRRIGRAIVVVIAAILVLSNWGYDMTTIIAGLGVGGIAVALAAQQTIANVFGGVSVIGDHPIMVGDFGNFGGLVGTVEDIGMRSTRVRTLNRTVVSVPNSSFASLNLENYAVRDKILLNPTIQVKRGTPKDIIRALMQDIAHLLSQNKVIEVGPTPVRISGFTSGYFSVEIFAYVLTSDIDEYYRQQADLFLAFDDLVVKHNVELA